MNTPTTAQPAPELLSPVKSLRLLRRMHRVFHDCSMSLGILIGWQKSEIALRQESAREALAVDDALEAERAELEESLRNDDPAARARILAAWDETHARTERLAAKLQLPVEE
jgi:hypothetical protein